jgi:SSS family solute:Na+ symporter
MIAFFFYCATEKREITGQFDLSTLTSRRNGDYKKTQSKSQRVMISSDLHVVDYVTIVVYFIIVLAVGIIPSIYNKFIKHRLFPNDNNGGERSSSSEEELSFFLAGRSMGAIAVGASLFSSNIGSEHFVGLSGSGASEGIAIGWYEWSAVFILAVLAYIFVPLYLQSKIFTTPEFIEKRFNRYIRSYLAVLSLLFYVFTKISVTIFAVAILLELVLGWNVYVSSAVILFATGVYTITGGLSAVIYTEVLQTVVLVSGAIVLTILGFIKVGGLSNLMKSEPNSFHLFKPLNDPGLPWLGVLTGIPISGLQYWCGDQVIVQRVLSARSSNIAQTGCAIASILKILPVFILVMPGIISRHLYPEELAQNSDRAFPLLVMRIMPPFAKGLLISSMLAAAMSSLASVFNSASTIFVMDVYKLLRKRG